MRDLDVRNKLHEQKLNYFHNDPKSYVIDEVEVCYGEARVDIAVINGKLHAYEIKSEQDTLGRLKKQIEAYSRVFDFITLVVGQSHLERAKLLTPKWWGLLRAKKTQNKIFIKNN
mgnify:CR=1 FL=1